MVSRLDHEVDSVSLLDVVLLQELSISQHLALDEQSLDVLRRCTGDGSELRLDICDGIGRLYGEVVGLMGLRGLDCDRDCCN